MTRTRLLVKFRILEVQYASFLQTLNLFLSWVCGSSLKKKQISPELTPFLEDLRYLKELRCAQHVFPSCFLGIKEGFLFRGRKYFSCVNFYIVYRPKITQTGPRQEVEAPLATENNSDLCPVTPRVGIGRWGPETLLKVFFRHHPDQNFIFR